MHFADEVRVGDEIPPLQVGPLGSDDLVAYAAASGDYNPHHLNPAFAQSIGLPGVIAHGMLVMGLIGRMAELFSGPGQLQRFDLRFRAPTLPGDALNCGGRVVAVQPHSGGALIEVEVWASDQDAEIKAAGSFSALIPYRT